MSLVEKSRKGSDMTKNDIHHIYLSRIFFIKLNSSPFDYPAVIALLYMSFPDGSDDKESGCSAGDLGSILGSGRSLEKEMATHSSTIAWKIPWTEEPGRLQSVGSENCTRLSNITSFYS